MTVAYFHITPVNLEDWTSPKCSSGSKGIVLGDPSLYSSERQGGWGVHWIVLKARPVQGP